MATRAIQVLLQAITGPYEAAMGRAAARTQAFERGVQGASARTSGFDSAIGGISTKLLAGGGLVAGVVSSASALMDYETALVGVGKTTGLTGQDLQDLGEDVAALGGQLGSSAEEMLGIAQTAAQLGVASGDIAEFTEVIAGMAVATDLTTDQAATDMARLSNILGRPISEVESLGSTIVALGNNMATTEPEILAMGQRLAAAGRLAGFADAEVVGLAGAMSEVGIEAEAGGTALSRVLRDITEAATTGNESLDVFAQTAGMSADQFAEAWSTDPAEAFTRFIEGLGQLDEAGQIGTLQAVGLDAERVGDALLRSAGNADGLRDAFELANSAMADGSALAEEVESATGTAAVALNDMKEEFRALLRDIGGNDQGTEGLQQTFSLLADILRISRELNLVDIIGSPGRVGSAGANWLQEQLGWFQDAPAAVQPYTASVEELNAEESRLAGLADRAGAAVEDQADAHYDAAAGADAQRLSAADLAAELRGQVDPVFAIIDGMSTLRDAQQAYTDVLEDNESTQRDVEDATVDLARANSDLVADILELEGGVDGARDAFRKMRDDGRLTNDQFSTLMGILDGVAGELDDVAGDYDVNVRTVVDTSGIDEVNRRLSDLLGRDYTVRIDTYTPGNQSVPDPGDTVPPNLRAGGGDVFAGAAYTVGETGREAFVPNVDGRILSTTDAQAALRSMAAPPMQFDPAAMAGRTTTFAPTVNVQQQTRNPMRDATVELRKMQLLVGA